MAGLPVLLAQCAGALDECDLPRTLPWYFGLAIAVAWLATVVGALLLLRRRWLTRRQVRKEQKKAVGARKGTDVELW